MPFPYDFPFDFDVIKRLLTLLHKVWQDLHVDPEVKVAESCVHGEGYEILSKARTAMDMSCVVSCGLVMRGKADVDLCLTPQIQGGG